MQATGVLRYNAHHFFSSSRLHLLGIIIGLLVSLCRVDALEAVRIGSLDHHGPLFNGDEPSKKKSIIIDQARDGLPNYEPEFSSIPRSIIGRADGDNTQLQNNVPGRGAISPGNTDYWIFPHTELQGDCSTETRIMPRGQEPWPCVDESTNHAELRRRASDRLLYVTLSVCAQPTSASGNSSDPPPSLKVFLSWTQPKPGSAADPNTRAIDVFEGFGEWSDSTSDNIYIAVEALSSSGYSGQYRYELTGSIEAPYSNYLDTESLYHVESDYRSGFFVSSNLTSSSNSNHSEQRTYMDNAPPFDVFIYNQNDTRIVGMSRSYCALNGSAIRGSQTQSAAAAMTTIGGGAAKQQFYVSGLNKSSSYYAAMALATNVTATGDGHPTGGGTIWKSVQFNTTSSENCQIVSNLSFCSDVNYAVPSNPTLNSTNLAKLYDEQAKTLYQNFTNSLDQIPCDTTSDAAYSLAVNCTTCAEAYKQWLCAVTIPRCVDNSSSQSYLLSRNTNQASTSRNPMIDSIIKPGPYKELPPCGSLCFSLIQNCPSALQFACPLEGKGFNQSYGYPGTNANQNPTCNLPGAPWGVSGTQSLQPSYKVMAFAVVVAAIFRFDISQPYLEATQGF